MKGLLLLTLVACAVAEAPAPYPPSGWRPHGPSFELPQRGPPTYLPPLDPRIPSSGPTAAPGPDVSVQGLPGQEQLPLFEPSPISGQQYSGPSFNNDLKNLDIDFQQSQYQQQQERYKEYQRQRELEAAQAKDNRNRVPAPQEPRQVARTTTEAPTTVSSTTEIELNQEEVLNEPKKNGKISVEVTKQKVQEYPGELFLSSLAQLQLQPQFLPLQVSGALIQPQTSQKQVGFDGPTHLAALPSVLAQQQNLAQGFQGSFQQPIVQVAQPQPQYQNSYQPQIAPQQPEGVVLQSPAQFQPNFYVKPSNAQYEPQSFQTPQAYPQYQAQPVLIPQNFAPENTNDASNQNQFYQQPIVVAGQQAQTQYVQPQFLPQDQQIQQQIPQNQYYQPQLASQDQGVPQNQYYQPQLATQDQGVPQKQYYQPQLASQDQGVPQNQYYQPQLASQDQGVPQNQYYQPQLAAQDQTTPQIAQNQYQPQQAEPNNQYAQSQFLPAQETPQIQYLQPQYLAPQNPQFIPQGTQFQGQGTQYQPEGIQYQGREAQGNQGQPGIQYQGQGTQIQGDRTQFQGQGTQGQIPQFKGQGSLQSGLDVNQNGNDIEESDDKENDGQEGATAVATAFGARTQPRVNTRYGAPFPVPRVQATPEATTTESPVEEVSGDGAQAQAVAVASAEKKKRARLRSRRIRPVYAVDASGRLILAEI